MCAGLTTEKCCRHSRKSLRSLIATFQSAQRAGVGSHVAAGVVRRVKRYPYLGCDGAAQVRLDGTHR
jgi:hypothetical protein